MTVRARKAGAPPTHPQVPHWHVCRSKTCRRHRYACSKTDCDWTVLLDCPAERPAP